jgi:hypothetical protein
MNMEIVAGWTNSLLGQFGEMTVRQVYYQLVSRHLIPNTRSMYCAFDNHLTRAREEWLVNPNAIIDRSRPIENENRPGWSSLASYLSTVREAYRRDPLEGQERQIEIWIEKEALSRLVSATLREYKPTVVVCRGYSPFTILYQANGRLSQDALVLYCGDHDPSGLDAYRDMASKLECEVRRLALTIDQVRDYQLPPNPTKASDTRQARYVQRYGDECWELDALPPDAFQTIVREAFEAEIDKSKWEESRDRERSEAAEIAALIDRLNGGGKA